MLDLTKALELAVTVAESVSDQTLRQFRSPALQVENKADGSPVTIADREAEQRIRRILESSPEFGGFDIVGEEFGHEDRGSDYTWFVDPIDGTRAFASGIPTFGTFIALYDNAAATSVAGVIRLHSMDETYSAARGLGAHCNGEPLRVSGHTSLKDAFVASAEPMWFEQSGLMAEYRELCLQVPGLRCYGDCFGHAMTARGALDALVDPLTNPWDVRATEVIIEEAGGKYLERQLSGGGLSRSKIAVLFGAPAVVDGLAEIVPFP